MSAYPSGQGSDTRMLDFCALPDHCFALIISLTSPRDACRLSLVSTFFNSAAGSDEVWIKFLPDDYPNLVPALPPVSSLKELYLSLCDNHVLIEDGKKSISLDKKTGKKCYMLAARDLIIGWVDTPTYWRWISKDNSRFTEVAELFGVCWFEIRGSISARMLSPMTHYKAYLVFKKTTKSTGFKDVPIEATVGFGGTEDFKRTVYVDVGSKDEVENGDQYPKERRDGWFEVALAEFFNEGGEDCELNMRVTQLNGRWKRGIFIEGIEIKTHY